MRSESQISTPSYPARAATASFPASDVPGSDTVAMDRSKRGASPAGPGAPVTGSAATAGRGTPAGTAAAAGAGPGRSGAVVPGATVRMSISPSIYLDARTAPAPARGRARRAGASTARAARLRRVRTAAASCAEHIGRGLQVHARVDDALPVHQPGRVPRILAAGHEEALQHHPGQAVLARRDLARDRRGHPGLAAVILAAVAVAGVHQHPPRQARPGDEIEGGRDAVRPEVRPDPAAPQDNVAVRVTGGGQPGRLPVRPGAEEGVRGGGGPAAVHGGLHAAIHGVLEPDRHRQPGCEVPVHRALRRPGPDRAPGHQVRQVPGQQRIQPLTASRQARAGDVEQELPGEPQPPRHVIPPVHSGVVDQPFPAVHRAGLVKVHPHHDEQVPRVPVAQRSKLARVIEGGGRIVDGARAGHDDKPVVLPGEHGPDRGPRRLDHGTRRAGPR